jgi:hypothetical protein
MKGSDSCTKMQYEIALAVIFAHFSVINISHPSNTTASARNMIWIAYYLKP